MTAVLECNATETTCRVKHMPLLNQADPRIDPDVAANKPVGCYDASIATIAITALKNRQPQPAPRGRTKEFEAIQAGTDPQGAVVPKEIKQLSWQYRTAAQGKPYYFHETVRDFGRIKQACNPYTYGACAVATNQTGAAFRDFITTETHITNAYIKQLMDRGFVAMIAYARLKPVATPRPSGGWSVRFTPGGAQHKVVFSGYQPGPYPLLINDVGSGTQVRVRLVSGMAQRGFGNAAAIGAAIKQVTFDPATNFNGSKQIYLEYEGQSTPDSLVLFIEHVDALSLNWRPPQRVWSGTWGTGWTHFVPFAYQGDTHFIAYNAQTGLVHFDRFWPDLNGSETLWEWTWGTGWTHFVPFIANGQPHFIAYNTHTGEVHFDQIRSDLQGPDIRWTGRWGTGWSHFVPFQHAGQPHLIAYNTATGLVHFDRIWSNGTETLWQHTWGSGWTHFMPFRLNGRAHYVAYNAATGDVHFDGIRADLQGPDFPYAARWGTGWTHLTPVATEGMPHFTAYNATTGDFHFDRVNAGAQGYTGVWDGKIVGGWSTVMPFVVNGNSYELRYNQSSGHVEFVQLTPL